MTESSPQRRELFYSGHVQGVGFRYTVRRIAQGYKVVGFVRNLRDGRVQIVVEGRPEEIEDFLGGIRSTMEGYVRDVTESRLLSTGEFSDFEIRF